MFVSSVHLNYIQILVKLVFGFFRLVSAQIWTLILTYISGMEWKQAAHAQVQQHRKPQVKPELN